MKDQFGNYVVQRVLQTCDDKHLEMILSSIKLHLNELKNYTYGKHIVARVEKLIVTGGKQTAHYLHRDAKRKNLMYSYTEPSTFLFLISEKRARMASLSVQHQQPPNCTAVDAH